MIVACFYAFATSLLRIALVLLTRWRVEGKKSVPRKGPMIVVCNHLSLIDPPLLAASMPRRLVFMAKDELFHSILWSWSIRAYGAFPIRRGEPDREALKQANLTLKRGLALGMFPEGSRSQDGQMKPAEAGTSLVALRSGVPVIPVAITGSEKLTGLRGLFPRPEITVRIGEPFTLPRVEGRLSRAQLEESTELIMKRVAALLPEGYRGVYR